MPAYAYPIQIKREPQIVRFDEVKRFESPLTLADLEFVGEDRFGVEQAPGDWSYTVTVYRSRLETADEVAARVEKEQKYMAEYNRRKGGAV